MDIGGHGAIVAGGASGLGAATARALAGAGAKVAVLDINMDAAGEIASETGGAAVECDVTSPDSAEAALEAAAGRSARRAFSSTAPASGPPNASSGARGRSRSITMRAASTSTSSDRST